MLRFPSKRDAWLVIVLIAALLAPPVVIVLSRPRGLTFDQLWPVAALDLCIGGLVAWLAATTYYEIGDDTLDVHCGPSVTHIALDGIRRMRATRDPTSAPAFSLDRIEIEYGVGNRVLVSPADKEGFVRAIRARAARVVVQDLPGGD